MKRLIPAVRLVAGGFIVAALALSMATATDISPDRRTLNLQGILKDTLGVPIPDGIHSLTIRLYSDSTGGVALQSSTRSITTKSGLFNTTMIVDTTIIRPTLGPGPVGPIKMDYFSFQYDGNPEMQPRIRSTAVPFSIVTSRVNGDIYTKFGELYIVHDTVDYLPSIEMLAESEVGYPLPDTTVALLLRNRLGTPTVVLNSDGDLTLKKVDTGEVDLTADSGLVFISDVFAHRLTALGPSSLFLRDSTAGFWGDFSASARGITQRVGSDTVFVINISDAVHPKLGINTGHPSAALTVGGAARLIDNLMPNDPWVHARKSLVLAKDAADEWGRSDADSAGIYLPASTSRLLKNLS